METVQLNEDANELLKKMYKRYKVRIKEGASKQNARIFGSSEEIQKHLVPEQTVEGVTDACWELDSAGLLECIPGDDIVQISFLTDDAIMYMENRFVRAVSNIWNWIKEVLSLIP